MARLLDGIGESKPLECHFSLGMQFPTQDTFRSLPSPCERPTQAILKRSMPKCLTLSERLWERICEFS